MIKFDGELIDVQVVFEDDEVVLMKSTFKLEYFNIVRTDVGIKDENGDIVKIIEIKSDCI